MKKIRTRWQRISRTIRIIISGSFTNTHVGMWCAAGSVLHNAFIRALLPKIDKPEKLQDIKTTDVAPKKSEDLESKEASPKQATRN